jgi:hypothetical protein
MVLGILNPLSGITSIFEEKTILDKLLSIKTFIGLGLLIVILAKAGVIDA